MRERVLVIEDDAMLTRFLRRGLTQAGYDVRAAATVGQARAVLATLDPDIALLDLMLPDGDGSILCRELRAGSDRLIVALSARRDVADRVLLLDLGADDFLVKPFTLPELLAHLRALSRRARAGGQAALVCDDLVVDVDGGRVARGERELALTATEYKLLLLLLRHKGQALDEETIAERLWGDTAAAATSNRVEVHVHRLRSKLQPDGERPLLHTLRAFGRGAAYVIRAPDT